jgi:hypothetical protein
MSSARVKRVGAPLFGFKYVCCCGLGGVAVLWVRSPLPYI